MNKMEREDQIEAYLDGKLTPAEAEDFAQQIANDPTLAEQVALQRLEREMMISMLREKLSPDFKEWQKEKESAVAKSKSSFSWRSNRFLIIISIALIMFIGSWGLLKIPTSGASKELNQESVDVPSSSSEDAPAQIQRDSNINNEDSKELQKELLPNKEKKTKKQSPPIAHKPQTQPDSIPTHIATQLFAENRTRPKLYYKKTTKSSRVSNWDKASQLIKDSLYNDALPYLLQISEDEKEYIESQMNISSIYFMGRDYKKAIPVLENLLMKNTYYHQEVQWFLALSYLGNRNRKALLNLLAEIRKIPNHKYEKESKQLQEKL